MATVAQVAKASLQRILVQGSEAEFEPDEYQDYIFALNNFMLALDAQGISLGFTEVSDLGDEVTVPVGALRGIIANMAIEVAPDYNGQISNGLLVAAEQGMKAMRRLGQHITPTRYPGTLPIGSGNEYDWNSLGSHFYDYGCEDDILAETTGAIALETGTGTAEAASTPVPDPVLPTQPMIVVYTTTGPDEDVTITLYNGLYDGVSDDSGIIAVYDFVVDWGDDTEHTITTYNDVNLTHTYAEAGEYVVTLTGRYDSMAFGTESGINHTEQLTEVRQWGSNKWISMKYMFYTCWNISFTNTDIPDLSECLDMTATFCNTRHDDIPSIGDWNVSAVTTMQSTFDQDQSFNQDIGDWDISSVAQFGSFLAYANGLSETNEQAIMTGFAAQSVQSNVEFGIFTDNDTATDSAAAISTLEGTPNWTFDLDGYAGDPPGY